MGLRRPGLRCNGYTLARHVLLERAGLGLDDPAWAGAEHTLADELLRPSVVYAPAVLAVAGRRLGDGLHAVAHITGGGIAGNLRPALPAGCRRRASTARAGTSRGSSREIRRLGDVDEDEMARVFNLGIGMVLVVDRRRGRRRAVDALDGGRVCRRVVIGDVVAGGHRARALIGERRRRPSRPAPTPARRTRCKTGDFVLKSGRRRSWFIDSKQTVCRPGGMLLVADAVLALVPDEATAIGGLTMGADPVAFVTAGVAATRGRPLKAFSVRKEAKDHGGGGRIAGALDPGDKVVVTEDTVTRGTSLLEAVHAVRDAGRRGGPGPGGRRPRRDGRGHGRRRGPGVPCHPRPRPISASPTKEPEPAPT